mgnify:CR=1 FL=1
MIEKMGMKKGLTNGSIETILVPIKQTGDDLMKLLTKNTDYAIRALLGLCLNPDEFHSAKEISDEQDIPYEYLRKIFQRLIREGLVESKSGGQGGVRLRVSPDTIKITDVIAIFQGTLQLSECMFRKKICRNRSRCVLRKHILRIEKIVTQEFGAMTIQSLLTETAGV